jgi:hypothetical protein
MSSADAGRDVAGTGGAKPGTGGTSGTGGTIGTGGSGGAKDVAPSTIGDVFPDTYVQADSGVGGTGGTAPGSGGQGGQDGAIADAPASSDAYDVPVAIDSTSDTQAAYDGPRPTVPLPATCPSPIAKGGSGLLIDDLSSGNGQIAVTDGRNGVWYDYDGGGTGTLSPPSSGPFQVALGSGPRGGYAARMVGSGFPSYGPGMGFNFSQSSSSACPYDASAFSGITFWAKAAAPLVARLKVLTSETHDVKYGGTCTSGCENHFSIPIAVAAVWQKYTIAFTDLAQQAVGVDAQAATVDTTRVMAIEFQVAANATFDLSVTDIAFTPAGMFGSHPVELCPDVAFDPTPMPSIPHPSPVTFTIDAADATKKHPISPYVYGSNAFPWWPSAGLLKQFRRFGHGLLRVEAGSDSLYNWEIDAYNTGYNGDLKTLGNYGFPSDANSPAQLAFDGFAAAQATSPAIMVGLSLLDYVAGDSAGTVDATDPTLLSTRFTSSKPAKSASFNLAPDTTDGVVYQDEFVNWVMHNRSANVPVIIQLDNEPEIWDVVNPEVHPNHVSYDEYVSRTIAAAKAAKTVAPDAEVVGVVGAHVRGLDSLSGWATTGQASAADLAKGGFLEYFLSKLKTEEASFGKRLVDYIDVHYYTAANSGTGTATDPYLPLLSLTQQPFYTNQNAGVVATRLQAPRSLWDPTFTETTWEYSGTSLQGQPLTIIPRVKARIAAAAPGVKFGISEWDFGGGNHVSGGLAIADTLGIFGREGLDMAGHFILYERENYGWGAMQAFRSYNELGGHFGDTSISATTSDVAATSVYASLDSNDPSRMVIVAINKTSDAVTASINITGAPASFAKANVFVLAEGASYVKGAPSITSTGFGAFSYTMPRFSVSVLVPRPSGTDDEPAPFAPDCVRTGNLALSSDFEENAESWMVWSGGQKTLTSTEAHTGTHSLRVTNRTLTWQGPAHQLAMPDSTTGFKGTVQVGYRYDVSGWVKIAGAASAPVYWQLNIPDDSDNHYLQGNPVTAASTGWVEVKGSFTPTITGALTGSEMVLSGAPVGVDIYLDDVTITATKL